MEATARELKALLGPRARFAQPLKRYTTWRVGGEGWCVAVVHNKAELQGVVELAVSSGLPWRILGRGSNVLALDEGFPGVVIVMRGEMAKVCTSPEGLVCGGGASLARVVRVAAEAGLKGLEWAAGIPASVGGAAVTNAGAYGGEMAKVIKKIEVYVPGEGSRHIKALPGGYRTRQVPHGAVVTQVWLGLKPSSPAQTRAERQQMLLRRRSTQPLSQPTAGCVFKNPPGEAAGRLIEACGLKGTRIGGAKVSEIHANFIVNTAEAKASEILELMELVATAVREQFGVELEPEVEVLRW